MKQARSLLPIFTMLMGVLMVAGTYRSMSGRPESTGGYDYDELANVAVMDGGRVMPLDTLARNALMQISGKQALRYDGQRIHAIHWLADVMVRPATAEQYPCFRIDHSSVIVTAGLSPEEGVKGKYFTYAQLKVHRNHLHTQALVAQKIDEKKRSTTESAILQLESRLSLYESLAWGLRPLTFLPPEDTTTWGSMPDTLGYNPTLGSIWWTVYEVNSRGLEGQSLIDHFEWRARQDQMTQLEWETARQYSAYLDGEQTWQMFVRQELAAEGAQPGMTQYLERVRAIFQALDNDPSVWSILDQTGRPALTPGTESWVGMMEAYRNDEAMAFNTHLASRQQFAGTHRDIDQVKVDFEVLYNRAMPFLQSIVLNVMAFLFSAALLCFGQNHSSPWRVGLWRSVIVLLGLALLIQTLGLGARIYIHGRPPVTNLYSSAVFMGWASVASCLVAEAFSRRGIAAMAAAIIGIGSLVVAHNLHLQQGGDTMGRMQAVLDSNFWLTTHVLSVTIGYSATFMAGILAILYLVLGMTTPAIDRPTARLLTQMVYGTICFALLFSFVGTVLGGIWADQSWGRFWGWDPKENGAVMIVIMNAITLHAWWGRMIKPRGLMLLAVVGNIITAWAWFGTNLLGVGLHNYGFMSGTKAWLAIFILSQLVIITTAAAVPTRYWWSFKRGR